jgi:hypothetical protein
MHKEFIDAMVRHMYRFEATLPLHIDLLTDKEIADLYHAYCGGFCPLTTI